VILGPLFLSIPVSAAPAVAVKNRRVAEARRLTEEAMGLRLNVAEGRFTPRHERKPVFAIVMKGRRKYAPGSSPEESLEKLLEAHGWLELSNYRADGPDGADFGYRKRGVDCVFEFVWSPGHEDGLTEDEQERLEESPQTYTIDVSCFRQ
jgi:hypothetical protein